MQDLEFKYDPKENVYLLSGSFSSPKNFCRQEKFKIKFFRGWV